MPEAIGHIEALYRYPVKSMAGEHLRASSLGWHGLHGDRRLALCKLADGSGFPWLTASRLPELLRFQPHRTDDGELPTHVRTPTGNLTPIFSASLAEEIERHYGAPTLMTHLKHGVFDDACVSVIASETVQEISRQSGVPADVRRFRPNIVVSLRSRVRFGEDAWVGGVLTFGDEDAAVVVTSKDERCSMVNLDPDTARSSPEVLRSVVRANQGNAGVYATVARTGRLEVGQPVFFQSVW